MNPDAFAAHVLERLRLGVIAVLENGQVYTNAVARSSLGTAPTSLMALRTCAPMLAELLDDAVLRGLGPSTLAMAAITSMPRP